MTILSALLFSFGFLYYSIQTRSGTSSPNFGSWIVWASISAANALICFLVMAEWVGLVIPFIDTACVLLFLGALWRCTKGTCSLTSYDKKLLSMTVAGLFVALYDPKLSTFFLQIPLVLAVWPTLKGALQGEENILVWGVWTTALTINLATTSGSFENWIYPITMFSIHASVFTAVGYGQLQRKLQTRSFAVAIEI